MTFIEKSCVEVGFRSLRSGTFYQTLSAVCPVPFHFCPALAYLKIYRSKSTGRCGGNAQEVSSDERVLERQEGANRSHQCARLRPGQLLDMFPYIRIIPRLFRDCPRTEMVSDGLDLYFLQL